MRINFRSESVILMIFSVIIVTLFSACSPIYPINPWDDAQVFMTIGKSVLSGKLMYHDITDHKGPILFLMHEWAAMLSYTSFLGIYLIECVCMFFYLLYGLKIMRLFSESNICLPLTCLLGLVMITSDCFYYGDSVEELSLSLMTQCLYFMLVYIKKHELPNSRQAIIIGIGAGLVFWTKFNIMLFYAGALAAMCWIAYRRKQISELGISILLIFVGMVLVSLGVFAYFLAHETTMDMLQCYFYNNIFLYGNSGASANGEPEVWWFPLVKLAIWIVLMLPVLLPRVRWECKLLVGASYGIILFSYATMTVQLYYFVLLFLFAPLSIYFFRDKRLNARSIGIMAFVAVWQVIFNWNIVTLVMGTFPTNILTMSDIVNRNNTDDSAVLTFSSYDTGIYIKTRQLPPNNHYFINNFKSEDIKREQRELVESGKIKYLARWYGYVKTTHDFYDAPIPPNYHLIYDGTENYRYRFYTTPDRYLWNLVWTRPIMTFLGINPDVEPQHMMLYERRP